MSSKLLPVRVVAGLVVTALERARKLPEQLAELPVTAASRAVQVGMRLQQRVTELAIKGDEVLALFHPVEDTPPWARFDEDDAPEQDPTSGTAGRQQAHQAGAAGDGAARRDADQGRSAGEDGALGGGSGIAAVVPGPGSSRRGEIDEAYVARELAPHHPAKTTAPAALPEYDELSLAQLRGKLRALSLPELEELLKHEHTHQDRAPFITMLSNRISTVRSQ